MSQVKRCTIVIVLELEGDQDDAFTVVDRLLEDGIPQDHITDHDCDDAGELRVTSARSTTPHQFIESQRGK